MKFAKASCSKLSLLILVICLLAACKKEKRGEPLPPILVLPPTGGSTDAIAAIDNEITTFMARHSVPGGGIAITRNGKLVYAKGYGFADKENLELVTTSSRFRIASLSKWITSAGIMKLIQEGRLGFNDKVFGTGAILGTDFGTQPYGQNITDITIEQLLHHTSGGWTNSSNDPMFTNPNLTAGQLITWTLNSRPLVNIPGTRLDYSNFGYSVRGRVIEKISGKTYEEYIRENIFVPSGIKKIEIAGSTLAERKPDEVKYYSRTSFSPYGYEGIIVPRLDAVGGWVASPSELIRFLVRVDGFDTVPDILNPATLAIMASRTSASGIYGCGLRVSASGNWFHGGGLPGTRTWMVRATNGFCWVLFFNTTHTDQMDADMDKLIWPAVQNASTPWPDKDLFAE